jgi:hypothetical protein
VSVLNGQAIVCEVRNSATGVFAGDHYKQYEVSSSAFTPLLNVPIQDVWETKNTKVTAPVRFMNPANKNGEGIGDPTAHLNCFGISDTVAFAARDAKITNQFGPLTLTATKANLLCMKAEKDGVDSALNIDNFKCYPATVKRGTPVFTQRVVTIGDQYETKEFRLLTPTYLCNPVKVGATAIIHANDLLVCYSAAYTPGNSPSFGRPEPVVSSQFGIQTLQVRRPLALCVPSKLQ